MIISIGYAACHWCHVMENECFEDTEVAHIMNESFISVKVDREERPDVDQVYMDAIQLISGKGGWPLNVIALPDGRPIYAVTYMPKTRWMQLLVAFSQYYEKDSAKLVAQADQIAHGLKQMEFTEKAPIDDSVQLAVFDTLFQNWEPMMDMKDGGRQGAPKFPMPDNYSFLMQYYLLSGNKKALDFTKISLDKMANGGIYDQIAGGFSRYSVDAKWLVPHFEKMLYDNSQLVSLYAQAYRLTGNVRYAHIVKQTLHWISRDMTSPEGGFYSSLDADADGEEGKYYTWQAGVFEKQLGRNSTLMEEYYNVSEMGSWEHGQNILHITVDASQFAKSNGLEDTEFTNMVDDANKKLLQFREKRVKPATDDKMITAWNAMMISAYLEAYNTFGDSSYLEAAEKNAEMLIVKCMTREYRLNRNYKNGRSNINAFLDDYAFCIKAYIDLYTCTMDTKWLVVAKNLNEYALKHFYDSKSGMFFYTSNLDHALVARVKEIEDNVIPSSNAVMANNLYHLGMIYGNNDHLHKSRQMVHNVLNEITTYGPFYSHWAQVLSKHISEPYQVAIVGDSCLDKMREFNRYYLPQVIFLGSAKATSSLPLLQGKYKKEGTWIYVCRDKTCALPVQSVDEALALMNISVKNGKADYFSAKTEKKQLPQ